MKKTENRIPKSLKECYEHSNVSATLWNWSEWLTVWGYRVFCILIAVGVVITVSDAVQMSDADLTAVFAASIISLLTWALYAFIEYCVYNVLSLLVASLAEIVQNTKISADVALYTAAGNENASDSEAEDFGVQAPIAEARPKEKSDVKHSWLCNNCGKMRNQTPCPHCGDK